MSAVVPTIVNIEVVVWLVRRLILTESDVTIDAREVAVGLPCSLELGVEGEKKGRESLQQAAKGAYNVLLIPGAVLVKPAFVVVL